MKSSQRKIVFQVEFDSNSSPYNNRHSPNIYLKKYLDFREAMIQNLEQFVPIDIIPKNPPKYYNHLTSKKGNNLYHDLKHNKLVHFPRRDSFEVSVDNFVIFSRLQMGGWPDTNAITQWTLRVYQKISEEETNHEEASILSKKNNATDKSKVKGQILHRSLQMDNEQEPYLSPITLEEKLPPISQTGQQIQRGSLSSNYTTLPVREENKKYRYSEDRSQEEDLPRKIRDTNLIDFQTTRYIARRNNKFLSNKKKKPEEFKETVYYADSKPRPKNHSFHWNIGVPRSLSKGKTTVRVNDQNPKKDIYRQKNVQLTPLPQDVRVQRDRLLSEKLKMKKNEEKIQKVEINLSESSLNCYRSLYDLQGNKIKKISNSNSWSPLICQNPLPLTGLYYFAFAVLRSASNMIQIGIAPLCYYPKQDDPDSDFQLLSYNCSNGMIKDSKFDELANKTTWRLGGYPAPQDQPFQMRVAIDTENFFIDWYIEDNIVASSKMPKIYQQGFRVILSLYNSDDSVLINEEDWKDRLRLGKFDKASVLLEKKASQYSQRSNHSKISHHSNYSQIGKIKKILFNSPNKEGSPKSPVAKEKEKISESFIDNYSPLSMDQQIQTEFVGQIRRQRLLKYKEKKEKVDSAIITDNLVKDKEDQSPGKQKEDESPGKQKETKDVHKNEKELMIQKDEKEKEEEEAAGIQPEQRQQKKSQNMSEKVDPNVIRWVGLFNENQKFILLEHKEAQPILKQQEQLKKKINQINNLAQAEQVHHPAQSSSIIDNKNQEIEQTKKDLPQKLQKDGKEINRDAKEEQQPQENNERNLIPLKQSQPSLIPTLPEGRSMKDLAKQAIHEKNIIETPLEQPQPEIQEIKKEQLQINPIDSSKLLEQPEEVDKTIEWKAFYENSIYKLQSIKA